MKEPRSDEPGKWVVSSPDEHAAVAARMWTIKQAAEAWDRSTSYVKKMLKQRRIPQATWVRLGKSRQSAVLIAPQRRPSAATPGELTQEQRDAWRKTRKASALQNATPWLTEQIEREGVRQEEMRSELRRLIGEALDGASTSRQVSLRALKTVVLDGRRPSEVARALGVKAATLSALKNRAKRLLAPHASEELNEWIKGR